MDGDAPRKKKPIARLLDAAGLDLDAATRRLADPQNVLAANHLQQAAEKIVRGHALRLRLGMRWAEVRTAYPDQWLVIEALDARTELGRRLWDQVAVIDRCADGPSTMKRYVALRREHPRREFCFVHTGTAELEIEERHWSGIRGIGAAHNPP
jgi:hypothetical protein